LTGKELVVFDPSTTTMLSRSKFHSPDSIQTLRSAIKLSGSGRECDVIVEPVHVSYLATAVNLDPPHYFLMYGAFVQTFNLWFPFTPFEVSLLNTLNVAPVQLHPNSWGFAKAYQIICLALGLTPNIGVFFSFYHIKSFTADRLVSLCALPHRTLFALYANNFKHYQDSFYRVRGGPNCQDVMYDSDGTPLFPFYWSPNPRLIKGSDADHLSFFEMETVAFLSSFDVLSTKELVRLETNPNGVVEYLSKYCLDTFTCSSSCGFLEFHANVFIIFAEKMKTISDDEFASYLVRAKQKMAAPDSSVDPLSQVIVADKGKGKKRGRKDEVASGSNKAARLEDDVETLGEQGDAGTQEHRPPPVATGGRSTRSRTATHVSPAKSKGEMVEPAAADFTFSMT
jgi:hypothetical protein